MEPNRTKEDVDSMRRELANTEDKARGGCVRASGAARARAPRTQSINRPQPELRYRAARASERAGGGGGPFFKRHLESDRVRGQTPTSPSGRTTASESGDR